MSIERQLRANLDRVWDHAHSTAVIQMLDADPTFVERLPSTCLWTCDDLAGSWLPGRG